MARRWHFWVIAAAIIIGVAALFWPVPVDQVTTGDLEKSVPTSGEETSAAPLANPPVSVETDSSVSKVDVSLLNDKALNAWHTGDIIGAMTLFEQAIDANPDNPVTHSNYGRLLTLMVSYDKALPLLERARDLKPDDAQMWLDLATLYERVQAFDESWAAQAEAAKLLGPGAITRDEQGRFIVKGTALW